MVYHYEDRKQEFGATALSVVDPNAMTVTIPDDARTNFLSSTSDFMNIVNHVGPYGYVQHTRFSLSHRTAEFRVRAPDWDMYFRI